MLTTIGTYAASNKHPVCQFNSSQLCEATYSITVISSYYSLLWSNLSLLHAWAHKWLHMQLLRHMYQLIMK